MISRSRMILVAAVSLLLGAVSYHVLTLYTVRTEWDQYAITARRYLAAALSGDSTALQAVTGSAQAAEWAQVAAAHEPTDLRIWATSLRADKGARTRDTVTVTFRTATRSCYLSRLVLQFVDGKVVASSSVCLHGG